VHQDTCTNLEPTERALLGSWVQVHGVAPVARVIGVSRTTLASAIAGATVRAGSIVLIRACLTEPKPNTTHAQASVP
jgi:hypothetical protein